MKIFVVGPSWVGDMMMSQSLYRTLKALHPAATIDVMAPAWCRPLLEKMPEVDNAIAMPLGHGALAIGERRRLGKQLKAKGYTHAYVLPNSFKSALVPFFAAIPKRTGWRGEMRYGLLNDLRPLDKAAFPLMVERYVALAYDKQQVHSAADLPKPLLWPKLAVSDKDITTTLKHFSLSTQRPAIGFVRGRNLVLLNAGLITTTRHWHRNLLANMAIRFSYSVHKR